MNAIIRISTAIVLTALLSISTAHAQGGPPYRADCAEDEARAHAQAQNRTWVNHDGVRAKLGRVSGGTSLETVAEDSGSITVEVELSNRYVHSIDGDVFGVELGAPQCTYGSKVSVTVTESESEPDCCINRGTLL